MELIFVRPVSARKMFLKEYPLHPCACNIAELQQRYCGKDHIKIANIKMFFHRTDNNLRA